MSGKNHVINWLYPYLIFPVSFAGEWTKKYRCSKSIILEGELNNRSSQVCLVGLCARVSEVWGHIQVTITFYCKINLALHISGPDNSGMGIQTLSFRVLFKLK